MRSHSDWPEAIATVLACRYEAGAGLALAFGIPRLRHYRITFNYWADGKLHTGELTSERAMPQGTLFAIRYNADDPTETRRDPEAKGL